MVPQPDSDAQAFDESDRRRRTEHRRHGDGHPAVGLRLGRADGLTRLCDGLRGAVVAGPDGAGCSWTVIPPIRNSSRTAARTGGTSATTSATTSAATAQVRRRVRRRRA
ncbi:MAG: hypothetical protein L0H79_10045 [Intrasporangium sp.]|uniref:hypothetical protein n=1 Tax=Intrasporangium sp. TaxID=1925024 RepID=UPI002647C640|nr:hypothetical protein [Intrasporangium sp.]MDN5796076.1 hypothetical protein [Intrasporangium sp.]